VYQSQRHTEVVPRLWTDTIEAHRRAVREAVLDTTAALVAEHGLRAVSMAKIAEMAGIGRATLYKYFPDREAILRAWHERQISAHMDQLAAVRDQAGDAAQRLEAVLHAYAHLTHQSHRYHDTDLAALLHRAPQVADARHQVHHLLRELLADGVQAGVIRDDVPPDELAAYCLHALAAASSLPSTAAVRRLATVTLAGVRPAH
jgi:AcrR family transcriptional regulator